MLVQGAIAENNRIDVPKVITEKQVKSFVEDGFLIVPDLITTDQVEELERDAADLARGKYPCASLKPLPDHLGDDDALRNILCIHHPHQVSPVVDRYVKHPKTCGILSQITAAHIAHWDGSVKCMQSMIFVKPPGFPGQAWHQDEIYIPTRDRSLIGVWIALDPATTANGCLWVIPGSHRNGYLFPNRPHTNPDEFDVAKESYGFDDSVEIPVELKAGSAVFFNGYLLHRSKKNRSNIYRRSLVNHYMNAWSLLPWWFGVGAPPSDIGSCDVRKVVPVAGVDPYAWKGYVNTTDDVLLRPLK